MFIRDLLVRRGIQGVGSIEFTPEDIVRSPIVKELVMLFDTLNSPKK